MRRTQGEHHRVEASRELSDQARVDSKVGGVVIGISEAGSLTDRTG